MTSSNWSKLKSTLGSKRTINDDVNSSAIHGIGIKRLHLTSTNGSLIATIQNNANNGESRSCSGGDVKRVQISNELKAKYVGIDCEMVGIGPNGKQSALARVCVVDYDGNSIYDEYVRPPSYVTDFRTQWSGIRKKDLRQGSAITLAECQQRVAALIKDKVLVGHALRNDLDVLMLSHPRQMIRDTATYRPYMRPHGKHGKWRPRSLKDLSKQHLHKDIQAGEHDPAEDARCAMMLYILARDHWEKDLKDRKHAARLKTKEEPSSSTAITTSTTTVVTDDANDDNMGGDGHEDNLVIDDNIGHRMNKATTTTFTINDKERCSSSSNSSQQYNAGVLKARPSIDIEVEVIGSEGDFEEGDATQQQHTLSKQVVFNRSKKRKVSSRGLINVVPLRRRKFLESKREALLAQAAPDASTSITTETLSTLGKTSTGNSLSSHGLLQASSTAAAATVAATVAVVVAGKKSSMYGDEVAAVKAATGSDRANMLSIHAIDRKMARAIKG